MLLKRARRITDILGGMIFSDTEDTGDFLFRRGQEGTIEEQNSEWRSFGKNDFWGDREFYCSFKQTIKIPERFDGKKVVYALTPFPHTRWRTSAQQFILKVDGKIEQGIDSNHSFAVLSEKAEGGREYEIFLNAYCDDDEFAGPSQLSASLKVFESDVNRVYHDMLTVLDAAAVLETDDKNHVDLVFELNEACNLLELDFDNLPAFYESCKKASEYLHKNVFGKKNDVIVSAIGHTHIDVAWRWRLRQTREKTARSFATVLKLMEEYPSYKFMSSQAQLYDYVKQDHPELFERIKNAVAEKKWEPEGGMWVESDTNIISGESLVRQFMFGKRFFKEHFGVENRIMWLPDVFGYSAALPQIMKKAGIEYFMTTKISWNEYTRFPYDTFMWKGIDGTGILSHFIPSRDEDDKNDWNVTYNANLTPTMLYNSWKKYSAKHINKNILNSYGHGDGGGGPERRMLEDATRLNEGVAGIPNIKQEFSIDFFDRLKEEAGKNRYLPSWRGELYLEFHRGVLTAQARNKKYNRKSEFLFHDVETLCEQAHIFAGDEYPGEEINENWKLILLNQFHDIIPGSSIDPVYEDSKQQYEAVLASGNKLLNTAKASLASKVNTAENSIIVFNTLGFERTEFVILDSPESGDITVFDGEKELATQKTFDNKLCFIAEKVPSKGYKVFTYKNTKCSLPCLEGDEKQLSNAFVSAKFNDEMHITSLVEKGTGLEIIPEGTAAGALTAYEDRSHEYEAWDIKCYYNEKSYPINNVLSVSVIEKGPARTVVEVKRTFRSSPITQRYVLYPHTARIDIYYDVDWKEKNIAVKADYPVNVNTDKASFDIQFGSIERPATNNTLADFAQFEVCGHKWADLSDNSVGLSVMNDCKYGWTVKDSHIMPTLLRSAAHPNTSQDRERHTFVYALYPHAGSLSGCGTVNESYSLNDPLTALSQGENTGSMPGQFSLVSKDKSNIVIETVKKSEDGDFFIVRTYEAGNRHTTAKIKFAVDIDEISECDLLEENDKQLNFADNGIIIDYRPFEIKTFKIKIK